MAYATSGDVTSFLDNQSKQYGTGTIGTTAMAAHIARADSIIDGYIGNVYSLPLASTPPLIKTISVDLAAYYTLGELTGKNYDKEPLYIGTLYKRAIDLLSQIRDGDLALVGTTGAAMAVASNVVDSNTKDYPPTFDEGPDTDWQTSTDKLDDISNDKD